MRKKVLAIVAVLCMAFSMAGCSKQATSLMGKLNEVAAWEGAQQSGNISMSMTAGGQTFGAGATYTGYSNQADEQYQMTLALKNIKTGNKTIDLKKENITVAPAKIYMNNTKAYISTGFIKDLVKMAGGDTNGVEALESEYVGLDMTDYVKQMGLDVTALSGKAQTKALYDQLAKMKTNVAVKQSKNTYTIDLNANQLVDVMFEMYKSNMETNKATIKEQYKKMGMSDEEINQTLAMMNQIYSDAGKKQMAKMFQGSTGRVVYTFGKDTVTTKVYFNLKISAEGETIGYTIMVQDTCKKAAKKAVTFPQNAKTYTMEELMSIATAADEATSAAK